MYDYSRQQEIAQQETQSATRANGWDGLNALFGSSLRVVRIIPYPPKGLSQRGVQIILMTCSDSLNEPKVTWLHVVKALIWF
jgi:hypothetical protein